MSDLDLFLKLDGVEGECQDSRHKGELQILSFSKTVNHAVGGGSNAGDRGLSTWQDAVFTMRIDKGFPKLFEACVIGFRFSKVLLTFRKAGKEQQEFLKITFSDVLISSMTLEGKPLGEVPLPVVHFAFNFARIEEEYRVQKDDGSLGGAVKYSYSIPQAPSTSQ